MSQPPKTMSSRWARSTKSLMRGERASVRLPRRMVPICVSDPIGCASPLRMARTPAMVVVLTAPRPTSRTPSFPWAGAISTGCFTTRHYIIRSMFFRFRRQPQIDPLQVAMTGVRMGERFVQIFCDDPVLLSGLAAKVGLSGGAAVVVADDAQQVAAKKAAAKVGALVEIRQAPLAEIPFEADAFDMVVVDDTRGRFAALDAATRQAALRECRRMLRTGGRIEVVEGLGGGGLLGGGTVSRPTGYDALAELGTGGFTPA